MSRFSSSINAAAVQQPHVDYVCFLELDFVSGTIYCSSADRPIVWGGATWLGLGTMASISDISETTDVASQMLQFTLSGVDTGLINTTLAEKYHNRTAELYVGFLDRNNALLDTPELIWSGFMDVLTIKTQGGSSVLVLDCENRLVLWNQSAGWLYTQEHQRLIDSTDNFFDQVNSLASKTVVWGNSGVDTAAPAPPTGNPFLPGGGQTGPGGHGGFF